MAIETLREPQISERLPELADFVARSGHTSPSLHPGWLRALQRGLGHDPYCITATQGGRIAGILPLAHVRSLLFGRFLVGLPYLNIGGAIADDAETARALIDRAVKLADRLDVRYLELRHEAPVEHPALGERLTSKVHMRLALPDATETLWNSFKPKVRNQIRKGEKHGLVVHWGREEMLNGFFAVFSRNMRDLGTPTFGKRLFRSILEEFPETAELCVVRMGRRTVASAVLVHGPGMTEVPSASSLRRYNRTNANMLMYWHLLCRAVERGQAAFDFGRSSRESNTYRFKKQWGAAPHSAVWQYHVRRGCVGEMRPDNPRYRRMIHIWQRLPVWLTRLLGPPVVRGIP